MGVFRVIIVASISYYIFTHCDFKNLTTRIFLASLVSVYTSKRGYDKKSLSFSGSLSAIVVGFLTTVANLSSFVCLLTFFVTSSFFTKWRSDRKRLIEENFKEGGGRNMVQVFCNGGMLSVISLLFLSEVGYGERVINFSRDFTASCLLSSMLGTLACCNGDTWASEIGTVAAFMKPRLITTWKKVPVGTNGGITLVGLCASAFGGLILGFAFLLSLKLFVGSDTFDMETQYHALRLTFYAGLFGSIVDSLLGAFFQYSGYCSLRKKVVSQPSRTTEFISGSPVFDNDQVNLLSSLIMAVITPIYAYYSWPKYD
eukprot:TCONS_00049430-protein